MVKFSSEGKGTAIAATIAFRFSIRINAFILFPWGDPRQTAGNGAEFVAVDRDGNIFGGEVTPKRLQKYVRVRPQACGFA